MNFRKVKEIVKFNVNKSIQNKWFITFNIIIFVIILLATNWSNISNFLEENDISLLEEDDVIIQVVDNENLIYDKFENDSEEYSNVSFEKLDSNPYSKENIPDDNIVLVEVYLDDEELITAKIVSKEGIEEDIYDLIYEKLLEARSEVFADKYGISLDELNILNEDITVERELLGVDAENSDIKEIIQMVSVMITYIVLIIVLSRIANEIAQEKVSKSIEYVLTSVTAKEYLLAKVLSVTAATLIQVLYTFVYYMIGNLVNSIFAINNGATITSFTSNIDWNIASYVVVMAVYLIFTVFLTALIQATLSSRTTSVAEAGNTTLILMIIVIALYMVSISVISPYITVTPFMYIISCLPIVSTFFVPSMMIIGQATAIQIIASFVLLILTAPLIFGFCSKHFKNGILDYTGSNKKRKSKKELSIKEKQERDFEASIAKKFGFNIGIAFIMLILLEIIFSYLFAFILPKIVSVDEGTLTILVSGFTSAFALGITAAYLISNLQESEEEKIIDTKTGVTYAFVGIALIGIIQVVLSFIYSKIGLDYDIFEEYGMTVGDGLFSKLMYVVVIAIVPAIFEELLFRKGILENAKKYGNGFAVLFSAILFGIFHFNLSQGIFAFLIGVVFGVIAIKTGSIKYTALLHFLNNLYFALVEILDGVFLSIVNVITVAILIFGIIMLLKNLINIKNFKIKNWSISKNCVLIFTNYTFVVTVILLISMFAATENLLQI